MTLTFTVLGCGTSTGVPVPGCSCAVCCSSNPKNWRLRTSGIITLPSGENILIDAGTDFRQQALANSISRIDAILFTHPHSDHILGIDDLRCFNFARADPIPAYGSEETLKQIEITFRYLFDQNDDYMGGLLAKLALHRIQIGVPFSLLAETITPFMLWHGNMPVTGFRIRDFVYATDCNRIPDESLEIMKGAEVLFLDALRFRSHRTHLTVSEACDISQNLEAKRTYLIHMSHDIEFDRDNPLLPEGISYAYDQLQVEIR